LSMERVRKKLAEAEFFLVKLIRQEPSFNDDTNPFDFYLSAFLNATTSMREQFRVLKHPVLDASAKSWRERWMRGLSTDEAQLYEFMGRDRDAEHHHGGSRRHVGEQGVEVGGGTQLVDDLGTITILSTPGVEAVTVYGPVYTFTINGTTRRVTKVCSEYLALLRRMVEQFEGDHQGGGEGERVSGPG
jgi:hypothetical protein